MAQLVKSLPSKYKDLSSVPQNPLKNAGCKKENAGYSEAYLLSKHWKCVDRRIPGAYWPTSLA